MELPEKLNATAVPTAMKPVSPAAIEQVPAVELADLRRRADRYRFLYRTIVTVTGILVGATVIVVLVALLTDL